MMVAMFMAASFSLENVGAEVGSNWGTREGEKRGSISLLNARKRPLRWRRRLTFRLTPLILGSPSIFLSNLPILAVAVRLSAILLSNSSFLASLNVFF